MAVPVHRRLLSATATVLGFWALVGTLVTFFFFSHVFISAILFIGDRLVWVLMCVFAALALVFFWEAAETFAITQGLRPQTRRGLSTTTLGMLPRSHGITAPQLPIPAKARAGRLRSKIARLERNRSEDTLDKQALQHFALSVSPRAELFWSVYGILEESDLPASPYHGSHGDASLLEHSLRVAAAMAKVWAEMDQASIGTVRAKDAATSKSFDVETAILAGLAHDLGKVLCFRRSGENIEVMGLHDIEGSRMLARLDAFWDLLDANGKHDDFTQRMLTQSIRYYHHAYAYPGSGYKRNFIQTDEAVVDLMQAIRKADMIAGSIEGREDEIAQDYQDSNDLPERDIDEQVWESFNYLLSHSNLINHKSPEQRIGYKQGNLLFLAEKRVRALICAHLGLTRSDYISDNNGNPGPIIKIITAKLDDLGILRKDFKNKSCKKKPEGAAFYLHVEGTTRDGEAKEVDEKIPYYLARIQGSPLLARFAELEDYRSKLSISSPTWPQFFTDDTGKADSSESVQDAESAATIPETASAQDAEKQVGQESEDHEDEQVDRDTPPQDEDESPWADADTPKEPEAANVSPGDSAEDAEPEPEPEPERGITAPTDAAVPEAINLTDAGREHRRQQIEAARIRAEQPRDYKRMIKGSMQTPQQRTESVSKRVQDLKKTYPDILSGMPELRNHVLFSLLWLDEIQRDLRIRTGSDAGLYRGSLATLLDQEPPGDVKDLIMGTMSKLKPGLFPVLEARMMLQIEKTPDGSLDVEQSLFSAPVESPFSEKEAG